MLRTGKDDEALNVYMEALELCPENPELLTTVGLLFLKLGNNTKAFEYLGEYVSCMCTVWLYVVIL